MAIIRTNAQASAKPLFYQNFSHSKTLDRRITFTRASNATYVDSDGFIKYAGVNEPRFDHDPITGECHGLLAEREGTNLIARSGLASGWTVQYVSISANNTGTVDPMGGLTAAKVIENSTIDYAHRTYINWITGLNTGGRTRYTFSCFVKNLPTNPSDHAITLELYNGQDSTSGARFDLINGEIVDGSISVGQAFMHKYPNGWWRIGLTTQMAPTRDYWGCYIFSSRNQDRDPPGITATETGFYIWGAQFQEHGLTSVIPTSGSAITRAGESITVGTNEVLPTDTGGYSGYWRTRRTSNISNVTYYEHPISIGLHNMFTDPYTDDLYHFDPGQQNMGTNYTHYQNANRYEPANWLSYAFSLQYGGALWGAWEMGDFQSYSNFVNSGHSYTSAWSSTAIGLCGRHTGSNAPVSQHISEVALWGEVLDEYQLKNIAWEHE